MRAPNTKRLDNLNDSATVSSKTDTRASKSELIRAQVRLALVGASPIPRYEDRRRETRHPYPYPVYLTPVEPSDTEMGAKTIVVIGKHLSECGLDFYYHRPLPYRRVVATLTTGSGRWLGLQLELRWCRFGHYGWYENGGRFVGIAASSITRANSPLDQYSTNSSAHLEAPTDPFPLTFLRVSAIEATKPGPIGGQ